MIIRIPPQYHGVKLGSYIKYTLGISTKMLAHLKACERGILVNGTRMTVRYILSAGDILELSDEDTEDTATETVLPADLPLSILYEDEHIIVLNKPAGMPTHPSHGHLMDTLANALAYRYYVENRPFVFRPLGRLDRNTSGVVITSKTRSVSGILYHALQQGEVKKRYLAILCGQLPEDGLVHTIDAPMRRTEGSVIMRTTCRMDEPDAYSAKTAYRVLMSSPSYTLVEASPLTGRTHQLRVHFSHIGHPIIGDDLYGSPSELINRHALHALSISIPLPFFRAETGLSPSVDETGYSHFRAPIPEDMSYVLRTVFPSVSIDSLCL
jgi:23S rRNA pseudouridine1911/1915/1917 synthase